MMKKDDLGTTRDDGNGQTRELMRGTDGNVVPMLPSGMQTAPDRPVDLSPERKAEIEAESKRKITFMEREYWRLRNGEQDYMRCPYCAIPSSDGKRDREYRINLVDRPFCCALFAKMFAAILDRQIEVDTAASHVRNLHKVGLVN